MAKDYYNLEKAAEVLGIYPAELNEKRERGEVHAYRDGADWKFKKDEIDELAVEIRSQKTSAEKKDDEAAAAAEDDSEDVVLSEIELGESGPGASGTVIGTEGQSPEDSDIKLAASDIGLTAETDQPESGTLEELDLTIEEDVQLEDSEISLGEDSGIASASGGSAVELSPGLEDEDLVLGGSGSGSDITIGQDSGISLVDPQDSGLSLDEPLELASDDESLALGEDDMLTLSEETDTESPTQLQADDDFLLTPLDEGADEEDSESGSQVIALDEAAGDEAATMVAGDGMAAMLDEEVGGVDMGIGVSPLEPALGAGAPLGGQQPVAPGAALAPGAPLPEAPFGTLAMVMLSLCMVVMVLSGMMAYDLMRNMWSWSGPFDVTSSLMDMILSLPFF
jgi:hypothetical protein